jgi:hypothetical protein
METLPFSSVFASSIEAFIRAVCSEQAEKCQDHAEQRLERLHALNLEYQKIMI